MRVLEVEKARSKVGIFAEKGSSLGFRAEASGCRVQGLGFRIKSTPNTTILTMGATGRQIFGNPQIYFGGVQDFVLGLLGA